MSLVALKRKTAAMQNLSTGQKGFSINGTHRSQGYIGQTSLSRSLINTPHGQTGAPEGHGGCCGDFSTTTNIRASETFSLEDENVVKTSVLSSTGMLSNRNRWLKRSAPYTSTKLAAGWTNGQGDYIAYLKKKAAKCDPTQADKLLNDKEVNSVAISKCTTTNITRKDGAPVFNKTTICTFTKPVSDYTSISQGEHIFKLHDKCADQDDVLFKIVSNTRRTPLPGLTTDSSPLFVEPVVSDPGPDLPIPRWVGVGNNAGKTIATSTDLSIWSPTNDNTIDYTIDNWNTVPDSSGGDVFTTEGAGIAYANGVWVAVGSAVNSIAISEDNGITWTSKSTNNNNNGIIGSSGRGVAYGNGVWVAVGGGLSVLNSIAYSTDNGNSWTGRGNTIVGQHGRAVAYGDNTWVAVSIGSGANTIATSTDGNIWVGRGNNIITNGDNVRGGLSVAYGKDSSGNNLWIAGGGRISASASIGNTIARSTTNGNTWIGLGTSIFSDAVNGVAYGKDSLGGNLWVAVGFGGNTIATSPDGTNWNGVSSSPFDIGRSVMYIKQWSYRTMISPGTYQTIDCSGRWVATGSGGNTIATSTDGITWVGGGVPVFSDKISSSDDRGFDIAFNR